MSDFKDIVISLGRGIIKILISNLVGFGVALLVIGITTAGKPHVWETRGVPGELLIGIGSGLLSGGVMMLALFLIPWLAKRPSPSTFADEPIITARPAAERPAERPAPRAERGEGDFYER